MSRYRSNHLLQFHPPQLDGSIGTDADHLVGTRHPKDDVDTILVRVDGLDPLTGLAHAPDEQMHVETTADGVCALGVPGDAGHASGMRRPTINRHLVVAVDAVDQDLPHGVAHRQILAVG